MLRKKVLEFLKLYFHPKKKEKFFNKLMNLIGYQNLNMMSVSGEEYSVVASNNEGGSGNRSGEGGNCSDFRGEEEKRVIHSATQKLDGDGNTVRYEFDTSEEGAKGLEDVLSRQGEVEVYEEEWQNKAWRER